MSEGPLTGLPELSSTTQASTGPGRTLDPVAGALAFCDLRAMIVDPALPWEPFRDGVEIHRLYSTPDGRSAAFLRYAPGATLPRHHHIGLEHILILTGSQQDERGSYQAGTLLVHPPGTSHTVRSRGGCVVLALWERPVVFE